MSEGSDDEIVYVKKQKTIHYGSLEESLESRLKQARNEAENSTPALQNSNVPEYFDIDLEM